MDFILYLIANVLFFYTIFADTDIPIYATLYPIIICFILHQLKLIKKNN